MKLEYIVEIESPHHHLVRVRIKASKGQGSKLSFFLPSWSPGSYLMREYARHIRTFEAKQMNGEYLFTQKTQKGVWEIDWDKSELNNPGDEFEVIYEVYCRELTVRTSIIDESHAFLHGPSYLMGVLDKQIINPQIEFRFPESWNKLTTSLINISDSREKFIYSAKDYDELLDCPVEIGCHDTSGFKYQGKDHHLAFYGNTLPHKNNLQKDIQTIVEYVGDYMGEVPYDHYYFITQFVPNLYGGLEHANSTVLQFDGRRLAYRASYLKWLSLVAHEYFHTWNIKRIRPKELGPFNYIQENYTRMLWLAEGLTSFVDELFVYQAGLCSLEEYLEIQKQNLQRYYNVPGRKFHSLEQSSFDAWIKLYRPDENIRNTSVSYYLKGGLVFFVLHVLLREKGLSTKHFIRKLWDLYKQNPSEGLVKEQVLDLIEEMAGSEVREEFHSMVSTTQVIDIESYWKRIGVEWEWLNSFKPWLGVNVIEHNGMPKVQEVILDGPGYKVGLNAGDLLLSVNGLRMSYSEFHKMEEFFICGEVYTLQILRQGEFRDIKVQFEKAPKKIFKLKIVDRKKLEIILKEL